MPFFSFPLTGVFVVIAAMVLTHFAVLFTFSGFKLKVSPKPSFIWTFEPAKLWHLDWFSCVLQLSFFLVHTIFVVERISVTRNPVLLTLCYLVLFSASPQFFTVLNFVFKLVSFKLFQKPFPTTCFLQHFFILVSLIGGHWMASLASRYNSLLSSTEKSLSFPEEYEDGAITLLPSLKSSESSVVSLFDL